MKKIIYTCDCCGADVQDPMQLVPTMVEGGIVNKYEHMTERHLISGFVGLTDAARPPKEPEGEQYETD